MPAIELSIITIGYASQETLPGLLKSINQQVGCSVEFIYVENSPMLPSSSIVKKHYPSAIIIEPGDNLGFSKGCNLAAKKARGEYLLFLNPDCEIQTENTLTIMLQFMRNHPDVGICGPLFMNATGQITSGAHFDYFGEQYISSNFASLPGTIAWMTGAALMISKSLFEVIKGFDERYFMYSEDVDICLTARKAGFVIAEVTNAKMMHLGGASSRKLWTNLENAFQNELSLGLFSAKHYDPNQHKHIWKRRRIRSILGILKNFLFRYTTRFPHDLARFKVSGLILSHLKGNDSFRSVTNRECHEISLRVVRDRLKAYISLKLVSKIISPRINRKF